MIVAVAAVGQEIAAIKHIDSMTVITVVVTEASDTDQENCIEVIVDIGNTQLI